MSFPQTFFNIPEITDVASDASGALWSWQTNVGLVVIDPVGMTVTSPGPTPGTSGLDHLAIDPNSDTMYGTAGNTLYAVDLASGVRTVVGTLPSSGTNSGITTIEFVPAGGPMYPGNGADAAIEVSINGSVSGNADGVHPLASGDVLQLRFYSPNLGLVFEEIVLGADLFTTGNPFGGLPLLPGDPNNFWLNPATGLFLLNGFVAPFQPTIVPGGFDFGPFAVPAALGGSNLSILLQLGVHAPGLNAIDIGLSDAVELEVL